MKKSKYPKTITVKGLAKHLLENFSHDTIVGFEGHYGEIRPLALNDIYLRKNDGNYPYLVPEGKSWRSGTRKQIDLVQFPVIDFGPDPD